MKITKQQNKDKLTITLQGSLDTITAPDLEKELVPLLDEINELTFDFNELEYISSAGIRILIYSQEKIDEKEGKMKIVNVAKNEDIMEVFEITGLGDFMDLQ